MNYVDILRINHPEYILTYAGDGTNYEALTWSIYNPEPNPIPKATLDAEIAAAVASGTGELEDLTLNAEQELYAFANLDESAGFVKKLGHADYVLDTNTYITGITSTNVTDALGYTPYDSANPNSYATTAYVDGLVTGGVNFLAPVTYVNLLGCAMSPPGSPALNDVYMIDPGGNTGVWSTFAQGDFVQYQTGGWIKVGDYTDLLVGSRFVIGAATTTMPVGFATGYKNNIAVITGNISSNCETISWSFTTPSDNDAVFVLDQDSTFYGYSFLYDTTGAQWNQFQAPTTITGGNAITVTGTTVSVDYGAGLTIYNDTIAVLPYPTGGIMNTLDGNVSSNNKEAYVSLTKVGIAGTYKSVTTDAHGRVTNGTNPTTLSGFGITDAVAQSSLGAALGVATLDANSKLISTQLPTHNQPWTTITNTPTSLTGYGITDAVSTGQLGIASGVATLDSSTHLTASQSPAYSGDVTKAAGNLVTTLATVNNNAGVFGSTLTVPQFTVNGKGLITAVSNVTIPNTIAITGDASANVTTGGSGTLTLATVNSNVGVFGNSSRIPSITVNSKGLVTAVSSAPINLADAGAVANAGATPSIQSGPAVNLPTFGSVGRIYITTDTGLIYRDYGTHWDIIGIGNSGNGTGGIFQSVTGTYSAQSGTTIIPADTTTPTDTEGSAIWTANIQLNSTGSKVRVSSSFWMDCNTNGRSVTVALFRDRVCIQAQNSYFKNIGQPMQVALEFVDSPSALSASYSCRVGINNSGTWYINRNYNNTITLGTAGATSTYVLMEIL